MTWKPCSTAQASACRNTCALPDSLSPSTRTLVILASGASSWMIAAQAVPCPNRSGWGPGRSTIWPASPSSSATPPSWSTQSPSRGWSASMPLSITATRTPLPVAPPQAHSGVSIGSESTRDRETSKTDSPRAHAGRGWAAMCEQGSDDRRDRRVAGWIGVREAAELRAQLGGARRLLRAVARLLQHRGGDLGEQRRDPCRLGRERLDTRMAAHLDHAEHSLATQARHRQDRAGRAVDHAGAAGLLGVRAERQRLPGGQHEPDRLLPGRHLVADATRVVRPGDTDHVQVLALPADHGDRRRTGGLRRATRDRIEHAGAGHNRSLVIGGAASTPL